MKFIVSIFMLSVLVACDQKENGDGKANPLPDTTANTQKSKPDNTVNPYAGVDISPMDMSYYPPNYPQQKMTGADSGTALARIIYSRPHLQGRKLFQDVLKYGEPWRLGANEATELQLFRDAVIQGKKIKAGRYVLYCIPKAGEWTIKLNANLDSWGLKPDESKDLASFVIPVTQTTYYLEYFTMVFEKTEAGCDLIMAWGNLEGRLSLTF